MTLVDVLRLRYAARALRLRARSHRCHAAAMRRVRLSRGTAAAAWWRAMVRAEVALRMHIGHLQLPARPRLRLVVSLAQELRP